MTRRPRPLELESSFACLLGALASREDAELAGHVDIDDLYPVEVAVGLEFSDDLLALFALALPSLEASHEVSLSRVIAHCGRLREAKFPGDLIGLARDADSEYAIDRRRAIASSTQVSRIDLDIGEVAEKLTLEQFIRRTARFDGSATGAVFSASLHRKPPMASAPGRVVVHKVFGRGTAFSEKGDGPTRKVTCDFPGVGLKVIQARFLDFDDG